MAEPITVQSLLTYVTLISVPVGVFYHIMTLRNTKRNQQLQLETRQAGLFMDLYDVWRGPEFRRQWDEVIFKMEFEDWEDMMEKYNRETNYDLLLSWFSVATFFEGVGVLLKRNLIDITMVDDLLATSIRIGWEKIGPIEVESRRRFKQPRIFDDFEYLYDELMKYHEEHPELRT
jgi:hypothetical protein